MNKGSLLVLALIAVAILSMIMAAGLTIGHTEMFTTQNVYLNKKAYYNMVRGVEIIANRIRTTSDPSTINSDLFSECDVTDAKTHLRYRFITGTMEDMQTDPATIHNLSIYQGFAAPPAPNMSLTLSGGGGMSPVIWDVKVTSKITSPNPRGDREVYSEVHTGIYSVVFTGY